MAEIIIEKTAAINTKSRAIRISPEDLPAVFQIFDAAAAASAKILRSYDGGENFEDYYVEGAVKVIKEADTNITAIDAPGIYQIQKLTAGDGGVSFSSSSVTPGL